MLKTDIAYNIKASTGISSLALNAADMEFPCLGYTKSRIVLTNLSKGVPGEIY